MAAASSNAWRKVRLPEVAELNPRRFSEAVGDDSLVSFVPMKSVEEETGRLTADQTKRWAEVKKGYTPFQDGDVLFAKITPCMENGKYALAKDLHGGRAAGSTEFYVFRPSPELDSKFLLYFLFRPELRRSARMNMRGAAGQLRVPALFFEDLEIPVPPVAEQQRIVAEIEKQFTRLDAGVASLKRVQTALTRYRASVLKTACEGRLVPSEAELARKETRTYETGEELLQRILIDRRTKWSGKGKYKEPLSANIVDLPQLPEGWSWATMQQLGELSRGKSKHRPRDDANLYDGPYPFVQTGDIRKSGGTIRKHHQTYSELGLQQSRLWPAGTLCITIAANIAETGILAYPACFPDSVVGFLQEHSPVITRYVEFFLRTARERIESFAPATAQKNINLDVLQKVTIPLPPLAEQERIVAEAERRLSVVEELEGITNRELLRAIRLRQSMLSQAFGRLANNEARGQ